MLDDRVRGDPTLPIECGYAALSTTAKVVARIPVTHLRDQLYRKLATLVFFRPLIVA